MNKSMKYSMALGALAAGSFLFLKNCSFYVENGEKGIIFNRTKGVQTQVYDSGLHFYMPGIQVPIVTNVDFVETQITQSFKTKDNEFIELQIDLNHKPMEEYLPELFVTIGFNYTERILPTLSIDVVQEIINNYNKSELDNLYEISIQVNNELKKRAESFKIIVDEVNLIYPSEEQIKRISLNQETMDAALLKEASEEMTSYALIPAKNKTALTQRRTIHK